MHATATATATVHRMTERDPFRHGALTDVDGVRVGHHHRVGRGWRTGTTVVLCPAGAVAAVDVRGGGPGTRETDALAPTNLVDRVHAVCLSGGSAYGLAAADGVMAELERRGLGVPVGPSPGHVVPVVPSAVIFDLGRGGRFGHRPGPDFGARALRAATRRPRRGAVGAGSGARAGGLQGGVGMASIAVVLEGGRATVAALAVVNAAGSPIDPATALPWADQHGLVRPTTPERRAFADLLAAPPSVPMNTTIGVVATDAALDRAEAQRLAMSAHDGLARAIRPAHGLADGDTVFALSTGRLQLGDDSAPGLVRTPASRAMRLDALYAAAAVAFERACVDAVLTATAVGSDPAYRDLCPSAFRRHASR